MGADEVSWWMGKEGEDALGVEVLAVLSELGVCVVRVSGGVVCVGCVPVLGVCGGADVELGCVAGEGDEGVSGCVGLMTRWVVGVTKDVVEGAACVERVVSGRDGLSRVVVVRKDIPVGGPVMWVVVETDGVGAE